MKQPLLALIFISLISSAYSQCEAPEILNWHFSSANQVFISVDFPEGSSAYEIKFVALYADNWSLNPDTLYFSGSANSGIQVLEFDPTPVVPLMMPIENYFYEVLLSAQCASGEWSADNQFYVSPLSLQNDAGLSCGIPFIDIGYLADGSAFSQTLEIEVGEGESPILIEDLSILIGNRPYA